MMARALVTDLPRRPSDAGRCPNRIALGLCAVYTARARAVSSEFTETATYGKLRSAGARQTGARPFRSPQDRGGQAAARSGTLGSHGPTDMTPRGHHEG